MLTEPIDDDALGQYILRRLGAPKVCIELTQEHLCDAILEAKLWFMANKGVIRLARMDLVANQTEYTLPDDVDVVLDVRFRIEPTDISVVFTPISSFDERLPYDLYANAGQTGTYSNYLQILQYLEMSRRLTNGEPDWRQENRTLYIFPANLQPGTFVIYSYGSKTFDMGQLSQRDRAYLRRYAVAFAKRDLGRVRSKFAEWPSAQGSTQLDGDKLLQEAEEELKALQEELIASGYPMPFIQG